MMMRCFLFSCLLGLAAAAPHGSLQPQTLLQSTDITTSIPEGSALPFDGVPSGSFVPGASSWTSFDLSALRSVFGIASRPCTQCPATSYKTGSCTPRTDVTCVPCSTECNAGFFKTADCQSDADIKCDECKTCEPEEKATGCFGSTDRSCTTRPGVLDTLDLPNSAVNLDVFTEEEPVVIGGPVSFNNAEPITARMTTDGSVSLSANEPCDGNAAGSTETMSVLALEPGYYGDYAVGSQLVEKGYVGNYYIRRGRGRRRRRIRRDKIEFNDVEFEWGDALGNYPMLFAFPQTSNTPHFSIVRITPSGNNSKASMMISNDEGTHSGDTQAEEVGFLAFRSSCSDFPTAGDDVTAPCGLSGDQGTTHSFGTGVITVNGVKMDYELGIMRSFKTVNREHMDHTYTFQSAFTSPPHVFANLMTFNGPNPAWIRVKSKATDSFAFTIDEDNCKNAEREHWPEWVSILAIGSKTV